MRSFISNFKLKLPKDLDVAIRWFLVGAVLLASLNLVVDPLNSRILKSGRLSFERREYQPTDYQLWDLLQIRRALRKIPRGSVDVMILGDSRSRQVLVGPYPDRNLTYANQAGKILSVLDLSMIGLTFEDYIVLRRYASPLLKPGATTALQVSFHGLGQPYAGNVAEKWGKSAPWRYPFRLSTTLLSLEVLWKRILPPKIAAPVNVAPPAPPQTPSHPSTQVTLPNPFEPGQAVQRVRAETANPALFDHELADGIDAVARERGMGNLLVFNFPLHEALLKHIRANPTLLARYEKFSAYLAAGENRLDLQNGPCRDDYSDGVHYAGETIECLRKQVVDRLFLMHKE